MTLFAKKITRDTTVSTSSRQSFFRKANDGHGLFGDTADAPFFSPQVQPKLEVSSSDDPLEREADRVAETVVGGSAENITPAAPPSVQRKEEETATVTLQPAATPEISGSFEQGVTAKKGGGQPLPTTTREEMEEGIGADFGEVRVHTGTEAGELSQSISAQAFTHGNDIFFNEGKYAPGTTDGQRLLAHELTHTVQQGASSQSIQRADGDDPIKGFPIAIPPGMKTAQEFYRYAELKIFGRVLNLGWEPEPNAKATINNISGNVGKEILFSVHASTLAKYKTEKKDAGTADKSYGELEGKSKDDVAGEIDKRYYESTGVAPGTKIKSGETGNAAIWNDFKQQVMAQKEKLDNLPPAIKEFLQTEGGAKPEDFDQLIEVVKLLDQFSTADFLDYKDKVNFETTDLEELKQSIQRYLDKKRERQKATEKRETIKTKLYGLEEIYKVYRTYTIFIKGSADKLATEDEMEDNEDLRNLHDYFAANEKAMHDQLLTSLQESGFDSIEQFGDYITDYEKAFEAETVAIAEDHLLRYRHVLFEEEKKINDSKYISDLYDQIAGSNAKQNYEGAEEDENSAIDEIMGFGDSDKAATLLQQSQTKRTAADTSMNALPSALVKEEQFDKEELASVTSKQELKALLQSYLDEKKESFQDTWDDIHSHPDHIYELDKLMSASMEQQQIDPNSIFGLIIKDKTDKINAFKILKAICFVIIAIALTIATFGAAGPVAIAAGVASAGMSLYGVYEAIEDYKRQDKANNVGLLTDDPSLVWVVLAIAGAALDVAALSSALKAAQPIAKATKAFDASTDATRLAKLEKDLTAISDLSKQVRENILRSAQARAKAGEMMQSVFKSGNTLKMVIVPGGEEFAKIVASAYFMVKKGVIDFHTFMLELKAAKLIDEGVELTAAQQKILKDAFEKAKSLALKDEGLATTIEKAIKEGEYAKLDKLINGLDFSTMDVPGAISHVKFRDMTVPRNRGIGGCHDKSEFAKIRQADAATYVIPTDKLPGEVAEVLVVGTRSHPTVPGVEIIEYKIPALNAQGKTSGALKNIANPKTVYDPAIWTDAKLEKAVKEAFQDAFNKNDGIIPLTNPTGGLTSEGYRIMFTYRNGNITSFWFD